MGVSKRFGPTIANDKISISFGEGKIYTILGENGAGKTTLLSTLAGIYRPDEGQIFLEGKECRFKTPRDALNKGIYLVQQNFSLVENFTVAENLALLDGASLSRLDLDRVVERLNSFSEQFGQKIDASSVIWKLPLYFRQLIEIQKGLLFGARILLLDEPTSVLGPQEVEELGVILRNLVANGKTVILTSHKIGQVVKISNDFIVMRRGQIVFEGNADQIKDTRDLIRHMFGSEFAITLPSKQPTKTGDALEISELKIKNEKGHEVVKDVSLRLETGQILGIAGVSGNGQRELAQAIVGLVKPTGGKVVLNGLELKGLSPAEIRRRGVGYVPEEGAIIGAVPDFTLAENLMLTTYDLVDSSAKLDTSAMAENADTIISEFGILPPNRNLAVKYLSGGNLQKMLVGRELSRGLNLLICYNPTKGLDIKTTSLVHKKLVEKRNSGSSILLISEDLDEVKTLSDRIAVMFEGRVVETRDSESFTLEELGRMMSGH